MQKECKGPFQILRGLCGIFAKCQHSSLEKTFTRVFPKLFELFKLYKPGDWALGVPPGDTALAICEFGRYSLKKNIGDTACDL